MAPFLIALVLGALSAFGFQPYDLWPFTLLAFGLLYIPLWRAATRRQAALIGWCFGLGQFVLGLDWIAKAFTFQSDMPAWLGWIAVVLLSLYLALFPALAALAAWEGTKRLNAGAASFALLFGAGWAVCEWLRGTLFTGFPWNPVSVALVGLPVAQGAKWVGTYALSGLFVAACGFVLILAMRPRDALTRDQILTPRNIPAAIGLLLLVGLTVPALWLRLHPAAPPPFPKGPLVHVVQPDIGQDQLNDPGLQEQHLQRLTALSGIPGAKPRLILWPESAIEQNVAEDPAARARIAAILGPQDVLMGGGETPIHDKKSGEMIAAYNSTFVINHANQIFARYDKAHLVPFGEYLPFRSVLAHIGLRRLVQGSLDFETGPGPATVDVPGFGRVGMQICYEMVFSGQVVNESYRPDFIFNPSDDAWFGRAGPPQHLAQARLRAIEEGVPIIRSTPTGISAIIDSRGRMLRSLDPHQMGMMELPLPAPGARTIFSHLGNAAVLLIAVLLGGLAFASRRYKESFI
jgi:apolipoprotein N-acyltransferase